MVWVVRLFYYVLVYASVGYLYEIQTISQKKNRRVLNPLYSLSTGMGYIKAYNFFFIKYLWPNKCFYIQFYSNFLSC